MADDAALMEASLVAIAERGIDIRHTVFDRFFAAYPDRRATFLNLDVSSVRMADETVQMIFALASGEKWVWPLVAELTFTHRNYGALPMAEYDAFIDMTVEELGTAAGGAWSPDCEAAWRSAAEQLKSMIARAKREWNEAMPGASTALSVA
jgi:hemoglobin-like flavoprotein